MKNLFDFATKELSQDAFLRWLFENYNCDDKDVSDAARSLLLEFINDDRYKNDDIIDLWTKSQDHKADITIWLKMKNEDTFGIIIEDKTYSIEHDQLEGYKKIFEKDKWWKENTNIRKYIFYKTGQIQDKEKEVVEKNNWVEFGFERIIKFWSKYKNSSNLILKDYANHMNDLYDRRNNIYKPGKGDYDIEKWESFFENTIKPLFPEFKPWTGISFGRYAYICFRVPGFNFDGAPYLEVRSRDCHDNKFITRILTYGMDDNNHLSEDDCTKIRNEIRDSIKSFASIFNVNNGQVKNKQLGVSKIETVDDTESFIKVLKEHLNAFEQIINAIEFKY